MGKREYLTKRQKRIRNRKSDFFNLAEVGKLFCQYYNQSLLTDEVLDHICYTGNNGTRVCPSIRIFDEVYQKFITYKEWASNGKKIIS